MRDAISRSRDDWSIDVELACTCADCAELRGFLASAEQVAQHWPLGKERRKHVHGVIDAWKLPVDHSTQRSGRPFVLQLRKRRELVARKHAFEKALAAQIKALRGWQRSG
jgi:hypothetical protein